MGVWLFADVIQENGALVEMDTLTAMTTLKAILTDLGIPEELLHQDALLHKDLQLDSTETVEISLELKRKLGVNVKLEARQDITLAQVCNRVEAAMPDCLKRESADLPENCK